MKAALSLNGATALLMYIIPNIKTAKPISISPTCFDDAVFENIRRMIPTIATTAVMVAVDSMETHPLPSRAERQTTQPVMLVPRRLPWMTATA